MIYYIIQLLFKVIIYVNLYFKMVYIKILINVKYIIKGYGNLVILYINIVVVFNMKIIKE